MRIKKLRIHGQFKRFHDLTIDLGENPRRIVALVGPNGCGKSSVLDAMAFLSHQYHGIGSGVNRPPSYYSATSTTNMSADNVQIHLNDGRPWHEEFQERQKAGKQRTLFSMRSPYRYNAALLVQQTTSMPPIIQNDYGASTFADLDSKMEQNFKRLRAYFNKTLNELNLRPTEARDKIIGELNASIQKCLDIKIVEIGDVESNRGTLYFSKTDQIGQIDFNVLSSGEKEVIDILLDLYLRKEDFENTIFLIDEPELHINSAVQRKLLIEINKLIGDHCQIWIATHSVGLLRALQIDLKEHASVIEFNPANEYASKSIVLKPAELGFRNWRKILSTALDDLTELILPRQLIYCEGRDKPSKKGAEKGFDANVYNKIFGEERSQTLFVSSGGNTELDERSKVAFEIIGKTSNELEIFVLKDRDSGSGDYVNSSGRDEYLKNNSANHRMLKRFEIENYLFDSEVIKKYCEKHGRAFDGLKYADSMGDLFNDDVKSKVNIVKNYCGVTTSVNAETFKLNLADEITPETRVYTELSDCIFKVD